MSLDRLQRAADSLGDSPEGQYLAQAVRRLLAGLDADQALELTPRAATRHADALLNEAADQLNLERWQAADVLSRRLRTLDLRRNHDGIDRLLLAADAAARVPRSRRRLWDRIKPTDAKAGETSPLAAVR